MRDKRVANDKRDIPKEPNLQTQAQQAGSQRDEKNVEKAIPSKILDDPSILGAPDSAVQKIRRKHNRRSKFLDLGKYAAEMNCETSALVPFL